MHLTTTRRPASPKRFAWSYSKLKNFESCPKRHWHIDIAKDVKEDESEELKYGNDLHEALAKRVSKGTPLPRIFEKYEIWAGRILATPGEILTEQKFAITKDFTPTGYFDDDVWFRGITDVLKIAGPVALAIDWKTGKILEDGVQLALMAACIFAHYPSIQKIRTEFIWLKEGATTRCDFSREDMVGMWSGVLPRVEALTIAHDTMNYPPRPNGLCKRWCPVTQCPHHGA